MEMSHKKHRPHIKVGRDAEEEVVLLLNNFFAHYLFGYIESVLTVRFRVLILFGWNIEINA